MSKRFIGGRDTKPEIDALFAVIPATAGSNISHHEVATIAGLSINSARFRTVTERWRKIIERGTAVRVESRERIFHFLTADEALDRSKVDLYRIGKAAGKLHVRVGAIDPAALTGDRRDAHFMMVRETAALLDSARRSAKTVQAPKPTRGANLRLAKG